MSLWTEVGFGSDTVEGRCGGVNNRGIEAYLRKALGIGGSDLVWRLWCGDSGVDLKNLEEVIGKRINCVGDRCIRRYCRSKGGTVSIELLVGASDQFIRGKG